MGRYRVTPGSSDFNSSSRDKRPTLSSGNLTLLSTIIYRARNDALTASDRDKLKALVSAVGYKIDRIPLEQRDKIRSAQKAVSASMQRVAAKQAKEKSTPSSTSKPAPLTATYDHKSTQAAGIPLYIKQLDELPKLMDKQLKGYVQVEYYRGTPRFKPVDGSTEAALEVLINRLPLVADYALDQIRRFNEEFGDYKNKPFKEHEQEIRNKQRALFNSMKETLAPSLNAEQLERISLPASNSTREPIFKSTAKAEFTVPPRPMR